jgi:hypothetical protein
MKMRSWESCYVFGDGQTVNGVVPNVTAEWINRKVERTGFAEAMVTVGWLAIRGKNRADLGPSSEPTHPCHPSSASPVAIVIPKFERWLGKGAKARLLNSRRQRVARLSRKDGDKTTTTGEDRREETPLPLSLDTEEFRATWERWLVYRREIRKPLKPSTEAAQLKKLAGWGSAKAVTSLEQSITNGWTGFFEPGGGKRSSPAIPGESEADYETRLRREREELARLEAQRARPKGGDT